MSTIVASTEHIGQLMKSLYDGDPLVRKLECQDDIVAPRVVAAYNDGDGNPRTFLICDLAFGNSAGAKLSLIPPGFAEDSTNAGEIPENIQGNLHEVLNIAVNVFDSIVSERLVLAEVAWPGDELSDQAAAALTECPQRIDVEIELERYQEGRVTLMA